MKQLFSAVQEDGSLRKLVEFFAVKSRTLVYGLAGSQKYVAFASAWDKYPRPLVVVVKDRDALEAWQEDLTALLPKANIVELTEQDFGFAGATAASLAPTAKRMNVLSHMVGQDNIIVLATITAAVQPVVPPSEFADLGVRIAKGNDYDLTKLTNKLVQMGYERLSEVENAGQFSLRGGILDIFPLSSVAPLRIEFFDESVESLREYDMGTKRSVKEIQSVTIMPLKFDKSKTKVSFLAYAKEGTVVFDEPRRLQEQISKLIKETPEIKSEIIPWEHLQKSAEHLNIMYSAFMPQQIADSLPMNTISVTVTSMTPFQRQFDMLESELKRWLGQKQTIVALVGDKAKANSLREMLANKRVPSTHGEPDKEFNERLVNIRVGKLTSGFELPSARLVVITERDIYGYAKKQLKRRGDSGSAISHFRDIKPGDYVVHETHGIGKYLGVETLEVGGVHKDYLHIKYGGEDKLFIPTDQVNLLQKFVGAEGEIPRLSRMSSTEWVKAKNKARAAVEDIAQKLIEIYAKRKEARGFAFSPDGQMQREFEEAFPYEETPDQLKAIAEIKSDMERPRPMDRLLCGDVGYGKTEVAIRAAYKAVLDGKQVAVLVPTTVLAQQHYQTFTARFADFGARIGVLCRFQTVKQQHETLEKVKAGQIDILIGTHALLNAKRVKIPRLGLLVVDEEQRFGVKQKEKIKALSSGIDVLTLSATPIPRTLHMSLTGARDMSIIETAPAERFPVQTYVIENRDAVIAGAIKRELKRGGQIYFVYNRIETIDKMRAHLEELAPQARIMTAHGRMEEQLLERVMVDFYEGKYDILLSTSIIENGLDVPNANTIIVYNADRFGLSQLYQMRGRVGRSRRIAFAYFVYQADKVLTEVAEKRLQAMKEFAELGAGFKIAMRDMEIRGAGNLLGSEQHGHIASVGFEMYCKLLEEAVERLKSDAPPTEETIEPVIDLKVEAYIDGGYIDDAMHKIEVYQRIAALRTEEEVSSFTAELKDRFGEPSLCVKNLLTVARLKNYARQAGIRSIFELQHNLELTTVETPHIDPQGVVNLEKTFGKNLQTKPALHKIMFKLFPNHRKDILGFALRVTKTLAGVQSV